MYSIYAQFEEVTLQTIALWPLILLIAGVIIWIVGWKMERDGGNSMVKWIGMVPLAVAVFLSYGNFFTLIDPGFHGETFRDSIANSRRITYAGYFAFLGPALAMLGFVAWFFIDKKMSKYR